jgi:hypothetical protein
MRRRITTGIPLLVAHGQVVTERQSRPAEAQSRECLTRVERASGGVAEVTPDTNVAHVAIERRKNPTKMACSPVYVLRRESRDEKSGGDAIAHALARRAEIGVPMRMGKITPGRGKRDTCPAWSSQAPSGQAAYLPTTHSEHSLERCSPRSVLRQMLARKRRKARTPLVCGPSLVRWSWSVVRPRCRGCRWRRSRR